MLQYQLQMKQWTNPFHWNFSTVKASSVN